ncbi:trehalose-phosphatase [Pelagibacterium montanilacus]|uniref:trehalose-phosphatase n=1 Tax=Pelagibacterium montanilacus TaxID=2185280 RepID=UPI0013DEB794|nr:trehalose-phosphatase [Pelagibacterium montanilacus]
MFDTPQMITGQLSDRLAILTDFDGTLVEIAPTPDAIVIPPDLFARLTMLEASLGGAFAIVSGRTISDIDTHIGANAFAISGSHGAQWRHAGEEGEPDSAHRDSAGAIARALQSRLAGHGLLIEPKPFGVALHYRGAPERAEEARSAIEAATSEHPDFHVISGKKVFEARPRSANKGAAIDNLMRVAPFAGRRPVFVGDDVTDEDGFAAAERMGGFGIKVGTGETAARYRLDSVGAVLDLFDLLVARSAPDARSSGHTTTESMVR